MRAILEEEIAATDYSDYFAVGACGPGPMTQDLANAVSDAIHTDKVLRGEKRRNIVSPVPTLCTSNVELTFHGDSDSIVRNSDGSGRYCYSCG